MHLSSKANVSATNVSATTDTEVDSDPSIVVKTQSERKPSVRSLKASLSTPNLGGQQKPKSNLSRVPSYPLLEDEASKIERKFLKDGPSS
jgi:hypothetical protein